MFASALNPAQIQYKSNCTDAGLQRSVPCPTGYQFYDGTCIFVRNLNKEHLLIFIIKLSFIDFSTGLFANIQYQSTQLALPAMYYRFITLINMYVKKEASV